MSCCVMYGCTNTATSGDPTVQFFCFPKHPLFAQQWVAACWSSEPIDIEDAQICSIHFDSSCFESEYKMDYLGNYTKVLRYDAVPNIYLPNSQQSLILNDPISITTDPVNSASIKDVIVYEVQTVPLDTYIGLTTNQIVDIAGKKNLNNIDEPVTDQPQLEHIREGNVILQRSCEEYQISINQLRGKIKSKLQEINCLNKEIKKMSHLFNTNHVNGMTLAEQKNVLSKVFSESQIKILSGKKKIYWSNDDMAMGYTIRHLSNKRCYLYLSKKLNFPLPALSSIKRWSTLKKNEFNGNANNEK